MNEKALIRTKRMLHYSALGLVAVAGVFGARDHKVDLAFRVTVSYFPFVACISAFRQWLKEAWIWYEVLPLLAIHTLLVVRFLSTVREVNIWALYCTNIAECVLVLVIVARFSPFEKSARRRTQ
jgi:hypothetical protein